MAIKNKLLSNNGKTKEMVKDDRLLDGSGGTTTDTTDTTTTETESTGYNLAEKLKQWADSSLGQATINGAKKVYNWGKNVYENSALNPNNYSSSTDTSTTESTDTNNYAWQDYSSMLANSTANSKAELASANQRAKAAASEYLKALGLQGSGMGQSQYVDIANNYSNALANVNKTAQENLNNQLAQDYTDLVNSGADAETLQAFRDEYGLPTGLDTSWQVEEQAYNNQKASDEWVNDAATINTMANNVNASVSDAEATLNDIAEKYGETSYQYKQALATFENANKTWNTSVDYTNTVDILQDMASGLTTETADFSSLTDGAKEYASELLEELSNAGSQEEVERIIVENQDFLTDPSSYYPVENEQTPDYTSENYNWIASEDNLEKYIESGESKAIASKSASVTSFGTFNDTGTGNGYQDRYLQSIINAANKGYIPDGTVIDVNYGSGTTLYCYSNGSFYPVSSAKNYVGAKDADTLKKLGVNINWK